MFFFKGSFYIVQKKTFSQEVISKHFKFPQENRMMKREKKRPTGEPFHQWGNLHSFSILFTS